MSNSKIKWKGLWEGPIKGKNAEKVEGWTLRERRGERFVVPSYHIIRVGRGNWSLVSRTRHESLKEAKAHAERLEVNE